MEKSFGTKQTAFPPKFRLIVFDAVIRSKLVYGLDCVQLPEDALNKLNISLLMGFRKIGNIKTTFVTRVSANKLVFERAHDARHGENNMKNKDNE